MENLFNRLLDSDSSDKNLKNNELSYRNNNSGNINFSIPSYKNRFDYIPRKTEDYG